MTITLSGRRRSGVLAAFVLVISVAAVMATSGQSSLASSDEGSAADGPAALEGRHLYLVPDTPEGAVATEVANARVLARYESFSLVSADGSAHEALRLAGADRRDDMRSVGTAAGALDPPRRRSLAAGSSETLALVQFVGPVKDAWLERLRGTGATVVTYMAQNAYLAYASGAGAAALSKLAADDAVRAVVPFTEADKTAPGIGESGIANVAVETLEGDPGAAARRILAGGDELQPPAAFGGTSTRFAAIDADRIDELAADPAVVSVEPWVAPKLLDERAAEIVRGRLNAAGTVPVGPGYLSFLNNQGFPATTLPFAIDVTDEGIDRGLLPPPPGSHNDFFVNGNAAGATRISYHQEFGADTDARDCGGHGSNVASIAAGFNTQTGAAREDAQGFNYGLGIAPRARLGNTKIFRCGGGFDPGVSFATLRSNAYGQGARVSNNSWGANVGGAYNSDSRTLDFLVRDAQPGIAGNQQMTNVVSAGNAGSGANTLGAPGTAKNVITVGASESVRGAGVDGCGVSDADANNAKDIVDFSSRGPTDDGRLKPDIVAPGTHVAGAQPQVGAAYDGTGTCNPQFPAGSTLYSLVSGTSQAAPEISGMAALIRDWYAREESGGAAPSPALTKAIIVNTATDLVGGADGAGGTNANVPTQTQGWGRGNMGNVLDGTPREFADQDNVLGASGQTKRRVYAVSNAAKPLKVTLAFTDAPGPTTGDAFVNDLDLVVHAGGTSYKGNVLAGGVSTTGGSADPRNNVENVFLPAGTSGRFVVEVKSTNIAGDGVPGNPDPTDQDYALVVSNAAPSTGPVLLHDLATATETGAADGDGRLEPGETFNLNERLRNLGTASATGVSAVLSESQSALRVLQPNSAYANIAAGGTRTNTTPFQARLQADYTCGTTAHFALDVTTGQGTFEIPFSVPTGGPGAPVNVDSADVPKAIPDNGTVQSTLTVSGAGVIVDLDVRNVDITHSFDSDLEITLIGPGGSPTATLANNRGGSGDNFVSTGFDDEAATAIGAAAAPFAGTFRPETPLSVFDGRPQAGTWTLRVADQVAQDTGTLTAWGLRKTTPGCN